MFVEHGQCIGADTTTDASESGLPGRTALAQVPGFAFVVVGFCPSPKGTVAGTVEVQWLGGDDGVFPDDQQQFVGKP